MTAQAFYDDPLDDIFGPALPGAERREVRDDLPVIHLPAGFDEPCAKCDGTGRFRGFGECFTCKGKGKLTFKTPRAQRERAQAATRARKERVKAEALEAFKGAFPEVWAWMDGSTYPFAVSLRRSLDEFGSLTERQIAAARSSIAKLEAAKEAGRARVANAPAVTLEPIEAAFRRARGAGLRYPRLSIAGFTFSPAGADSANAGAIYVKQGGEYLGKVAAGKFQCTRECGDERRDAIVEISRDPQAAALAHGKKFGVCAVCNRDLTDPKSVEAGIGPVCATKFGW